MEFAHRGAVLLRPLPQDPARGRWLGYKDTVRGPALDWRTDLGVIRLVHCGDSKAAGDVASAGATSRLWPARCCPGGPTCCVFGV
ncbi:hypothetical protein [Streptomyces sp. 5-6(2022)]|uniref:hypothetical protein n=1 Tax=Streptomyces sp. 5-6(2022) TaxID=2936510 RepID=UPI0023B9059A|nr:hypothetical protein [Streptomyces sp. 5-6(2022)]